MFQLKKNIVGDKRENQDPTAVENRISKEIITNKDEIKAETLSYCVELLKPNTIDDDYKEIVEMKHKLHEKRMQEKFANEPKLTNEMFYEALKELSSKKKDKYRFIVKAGESFIQALLNLFKYVWDEEKKPDQWQLDTLVQIYKKGSKLDINNYRYIHTKDDIQKLFGFLVTKQIKEKVVASFSRYQIGAAPKHRPQEHVFVVRRLISLYEMMKKPLILSYFDMSIFFDKESLVDALHSGL